MINGSHAAQAPRQLKKPSIAQEPKGMPSRPEVEAELPRPGLDLMQFSAPVAHAASRGPASSHGLTPPRVYRVKAGNVYLRTKALGLVTGTLKRGQEFVATYVTKGGWAWGYARGHADKWGWIPLGSKNKTGRSHPNVVRTHEHAPRGFHAVPKRDQSTGYNFTTKRDVDADSTGKTHYTEKATVLRKTGFYANVHGSHGLDRMGTFHKGDTIRARYKYNDDFNVVLVTRGKDDPNARWGFVRRDDMKVHGRFGR